MFSLTPLRVDLVQVLILYLGGKIGGKRFHGTWGHGTFEATRR
jgi:hypothetical protein